jgi:hypothetical protein
MTKTVSLHALILIAMLNTLGACTTPPELNKAEVSSPVVAFIDLDKFDHALATSLASGLNTVEVPFRERVSPNKIPERMKAWLNHVEKNGGRIQVQEPPSASGVTAKNPFLIFSIINALKTLNDMSVKAAQEKNFFSNIKGHDAKVILGYNADNEVVVDKVILTKTTTP